MSADNRGRLFKYEEVVMVLEAFTDLDEQVLDDWLEHMDAGECNVAMPLDEHVAERARILAYIREHPEKYPPEKFPQAQTE